jgi:hypothetical protein
LFCFFNLVFFNLQKTLRCVLIMASPQQPQQPQQLDAATTKIALLEAANAALMAQLAKKSNKKLTREEKAAKAAEKAAKAAEKAAHAKEQYAKLLSEVGEEGARLAAGVLVTKAQVRGFISAQASTDGRPIHECLAENGFRQKIITDLTQQVGNSFAEALRSENTALVHQVCDYDLKHHQEKPALEALKKQILESLSEDEQTKYDTMKQGEKAAFMKKQIALHKRSREEANDNHVTSESEKKSRPELNEVKNE